MPRGSAENYGPENYGSENYRNQESALDYRTGYQHGNSALTEYRTRLQETDERTHHALESGENLAHSEQGAAQACASIREAMDATGWDSEEERLDAALETTRSAFEPAYQEAAEGLHEPGILETLAGNVREFAMALLDDAITAAAAVQIMEQALEEAATAASGAAQEAAEWDLKAVDSMGDAMTADLRAKARQIQEP